MDRHTGFTRAARDLGKSRGETSEESRKQDNTSLPILDLITLTVHRISEYHVHYEQARNSMIIEVQMLRAGLRPRPPLRCPRAYIRPVQRTFRSSARQQQQHRKASFSSRLNSALGATKIQWKPIPIGLGIAFLGAFQLYRVQSRENDRQLEEERQRAENGETDGLDSEGRPKRRKRIRPSGPWYVYQIRL